MYTLHIPRQLAKSEAEIERSVSHLAAQLESRHSEVTKFSVSVGLSRPRSGPAGFRVRILLDVAGGRRRAVVGDSLEHVHAALRTAFDAAHAHLSHHARHRRHVRSARNSQSAAAP